MFQNFSRFAAGVLIVGLSASGAVHAQVPGTWEAGKNYFLIDPPQPTQSGNKIEVTEVFSYGCPACNFSSPYIDKLVKSLPPNAAMNYVPAAFNPAEDWPLFQRTFFTAQALGLELDKTHHAMFDAVWKTHELSTMEPDGRTLKKPQPSVDDVAKFFVRFGIKPEDFVATASSFSINTKMKQADAYVKTCGVDVTPTIIVNGKYRLTTTSAGGDWDKATQLVLFLVAREAGAK
ncbi:MAG: thiol:disulfide interchange protein DsbA/DsbL [Rudaea sp.]|nr:thiol:disulfide interchange protein DsbA/DsbL [Rudaea sp.]